MWPENWPAVLAFLTAQTQWTHGFNGPTGLDYVRARTAWALAGIAESPELFAKVQIMEAGVLETLASQQKRQESRRRK